MINIPDIACPGRDRSREAAQHQTVAPSANGLRWIIGMNAALWGIIVAAFWIIA